MWYYKLMYAHSEKFHDTDGSSLPITTQELAARVGEIHGDGITLRLLREQDAQPYFDLIDFDRDHLSQFGDTTADKYKTVEAVTKSILEPENPFRLRFGVWNGNVMVGSINITPGQEETAEIGYLVGKEHIGNNYAPKAVDTLTEFAFNGLGYTKLEAEVERDNKASARVLEKCGFRADSIRGYVNPGDYKGPKNDHVFNVFSKSKSVEQ